MGFTLIELLTSLAIISILGTVSYPLYNNHLIKMRRIYATVALVDQAGKLEEYHALHNTYINATIINTIEHYHINLTTTENTYVLRADPFGKQAKSDILCGSLTIDQDGNKNISGNGHVKECWY